eukprot:9197597-Alexandrium_andersonii.AAC.1
MQFQSSDLPAAQWHPVIFGPSDGGSTREGWNTRLRGGGRGASWTPEGTPHMPERYARSRSG